MQQRRTTASNNSGASSSNSVALLSAPLLLLPRPAHSAGAATSATQQLQRRYCSASHGYHHAISCCHGSTQSTVCCCSSALLLCSALLSTTPTAAAHNSCHGRPAPLKTNHTGTSTATCAATAVAVVNHVCVCPVLLLSCVISLLSPPLLGWRVKFSARLLGGRRGRRGGEKRGCWPIAWSRYVPARGSSPRPPSCVLCMPRSGLLLSHNCRAAAAVLAWLCVWVGEQRRWKLNSRENTRK